jgi:phosphoribosyl 1,2-cyclic phosphate phosphodiesterase
MEIIFLGTGTSHGVPMLDCMIDGYARCKKNVCRLSEADARHRRTRASIIAAWNGINVLIDASLDFRAQALRERIGRIDAMLITHSHADHIGGIPDLRSYDRVRGGRPLPLYGSPESIAMVRSTYHYLFNPATFIGGGISSINAIGITEPFELFGKTITPIPVSHGELAGCLGYQIGPVVYIPDMKAINDASIEICRNTDTLILNCLREEPEHVSHLTLAESIAIARRLAPRQCFFTHLSHDIHYELDGAKLEPWMDFAFDGLRISL